MPQDAEEETPKPPWWKVFLLVGLPTLFPVGLIIWLFSQMVQEKHSVLQIFIMALFLALLLLLAVLGGVLVHNTNEDSISGMVAQRYNVVSYLTILMVVAITSFSSCFIVAGGIARDLLGKSNNVGVVIVAGLSPLISSLILVFPLVVTKRADELGMIPLSFARHEDVRTFLAAELPPAIVDAIRATPTQVLQQLAEHASFTMTFYSCSERCHNVLHFMCVAVGVVSGYVTVIINLTAFASGSEVGMEAFLLGVSGVSLFLFVAAGIMRTKKNQHKQHVLLVEFLGLYFYMLALIYTSVVAGALIPIGMNSE